ncbi:MAG: AAA family ATPase [Akkermansiaceae bacterium]|nr:AAA family ATPase [Akkermansiaceae bacterium]
MADIESLKQALAVSPQNVPLILLLANTYLEQFHLDEAREQFERVLAIEANHAAARTGIAQILELNGKTSEAILRLEQVCAQEPDHAPAWFLRAKLSLNEGDAAAAREHYDRAVGLDPALADEELLKRIEQAGGRRRGASPPGDRESRATPQRGGDWQAGAYFDPDFEFDDDEDADPFGPPYHDMPPSPLDELELDFEQKADIDFTKVGGMDGVKEDIRMKILYPLQNKELFEAYGKKAGGGVLLYGPPGCGKTLISRATAGEIKAKFLSVGLHQILDMWIGKSEERLHEIFELARRHAPAVLFFDEVDALAADRKDMRTSAGRTLINQFLAELDGNIGANDGVLVLGATNAPWHLDSAFLRPGRFDRLIFVPPPDVPARAEIVRIMAEGKPVTGLDPETLAKVTKDFSGADIKATFDQAVEAALGEAMKSGKIVPVTQKQLVKSAKAVKPSARKWFESAKNYALYANQSGFYDDVLDYLGLNK